MATRGHAAGTGGIVGTPVAAEAEGEKARLRAQGSQ